MTLIVGLRGADGVVLASDSQVTHGALKQSRLKLFRSKPGVVWGTAGETALSQDLYTELERVGLEPDLDRESTKTGIKKAMLAIQRQRSEGQRTEWFEGLFAWYSRAEARTFLLLARQDGRVEFMPRYGTIGSSRQLGEIGFFGFSRSEYLDYETLPLEITKMNDTVTAFRMHQLDFLKRPEGRTSHRGAPGRIPGET